MAEKCDYLLFDISNILHQTFYAQRSGESDMTLAGLASHMALTTLNKYFKLYNPTKGVVMAFDRSSWRKEYMASDLAISNKAYKGHRRQNMTASQEAKYRMFLGHLNEFEEMISNNTTIITLARESLEADDLISGFIRLNKDSNIVLVSTDSDMLQLLQFENLTIVSPRTGKVLTLDEFDNDPLYYTFYKCVRGDQSDNIQSAFPGVRETRIRKAYSDPYEMVNLMESTWTDQNGVTYLVKDLYEENQLLINLTAQPGPVMELIDSTVLESMVKHKKFNLFNFMKFLSKYELENIKKGIDAYMPMMALRPKS